VANLIENERSKLTATFVNGLSITSMAAGFFTPWVAATLGIHNGRHHGYFWLTLATLTWLVIAFALHWLARRLLGGLRE